MTQSSLGHGSLPGAWPPAPCAERAGAPWPRGPRVPRPVPRLLLVTHHTLARLLGRSGRPWGPARRQADLCVSGAPSVRPCSQGASAWLLSLLCGCSAFANNSPRLLPAFKRAHGGFTDSSPQGDTPALTARPLRLTRMPESVFQRESGGRGMEPSCSRRWRAARECGCTRSSLQTLGGTQPLLQTLTGTASPEG